MSINELHLASYRIIEECGAHPSFKAVVVSTHGFIPYPSRRYEVYLRSWIWFDTKAGCDYTWTSPVPNPNELNSALSYYLHLGQLTDPRQRVVGSLLTQIMSEPAFNVLRTNEQLGYIVSCSRWNLPGESQFGLRIVVQSERKTTYLEGRVEAFLDNMDQKIRDMGSSEFRDFKSGLQQKWREPAKNLAEEVSRYWSQIDSGYLDFMRGGLSVLIFRVHTMLLSSVDRLR